MSNFLSTQAVLRRYRSAGTSLLILAVAWAVPTFALDDDPSNDADGEFVASLFFETGARRVKRPCRRVSSFRIRPVAPDLG